MHGLHTLLSLFELWPQLPSLSLALQTQCQSQWPQLCVYLLFGRLARAQPAAVYRERAELRAAAGSLTASESQETPLTVPGNPGTAPHQLWTIVIIRQE